MTEKRSGGVFLGGIPTEIDINIIMQMWPENEMKLGDKISYQDIETIIDQTRDTKRFRTVTSRWRRKVEALTGKVIGVDAGIGFKVLTEKEKLELGRQKLIESSRRAKRATTVLSITNRKELSEQDQASLDHAARVAANVVLQSQVRIGCELPQI